ncbi:alpha-L-fucosidase [Actinopolymorpha sp. B11F2]|uniref:alpha-L-fucosidase n=1 Tax=Actinopolymorpha sp. B11F2 TaxID=3160862 RepID=UPI0032E4543D
MSERKQAAVQPEWFRNAKFGIWAHWGPQSVPMRGDWYARRLYLAPVEPAPDEVGPTSRRLFHERHFGHPSRLGHKDICHAWKAERWDPDDLLDLYSRVGARYFVALANHIDNFDLWDSAHQPWNTVGVGPRTDVVGRWAQAARRRGLPFGLSFHANWSWQLLDVAFGADENGPYAGVPYDGHLTAADGAGTWWEGLDPADLYDRPRRADEPPDPAYVERFYRRVWDAFCRYRPQYVYFDDSSLPFDAGSVCEADPPSARGWEVVRAMHEHSRQWYGDAGRVVPTVKRLDGADGDLLALDVERHLLLDAQAQPWQMDTCLGHWFYDEGLEYKSATQVIRMLVDVVSKNGNLLLSVPQRPDGTIDEREVAILGEIGAWLTRNGEAIFDTRPWLVYGEGPTTGERGEGADRFREADLPYTAEDIRFTAQDDLLYATILGQPDEPALRIATLGSAAGLLAGDPKSVELLGVDAAVSWHRDDDALVVRLPERLPWRHTATLRIRLA